MLTAAEEEYLTLLREADIGDGLAIPVFGPAGRDGYVGMGFSDRTQLSNSIMQTIHTGCQMGHLRFCELIGENIVRPVLSSREMEVLRWIVLGKSNSVISQIVGLSANTVDTYIRRIFKKLEANDRVSVSLRAMALGLVQTVPN